MNLFLYGTLMKDLYWHMLIKKHAKFVDFGTIQGKMYLLPSTNAPIPCVVQTDDPKNRVCGEVWELPTQHAAWIDNFEADAGYAPTDVIVETETDFIKARAYFYPEAAVCNSITQYKRIESGDYRKFLASLK